MKYLVKNRKTGEETLCEKVVVDNHDYYITDSEISNGDWVISKDSISPIFLDGGDLFPEMLDLSKWSKVIATTNKSLGLPMVIDEVEELLQKSMIEKDVRDNSNRFSLDEQIQRTGGFIVGFKDAYHKAKETYQFTKEDLIDFKQQASKILQQINGASDEGLFDIWQEQRTIKTTVE